MDNEIKTNPKPPRNQSGGTVTQNRPPRGALEHSAVPEHEPELEGSDQSQGTSFAERKPVITEDVGLQGLPSIAPRETSVPEASWTLADVLRKPIVLKNSVVTTSDTSNKVLTYWMLPNDLPACIQDIVFKTSQYNRLNFKARLQVNSNKFNQGKLALLWQPYNLGATVNMTYTQAWTTLPHSICDLSASNSCELDIPFVAPFMFNYFQYFALGTLTVVVLNKLQSSKSNSVGYTLWVEASMASAHIPVLQDAPVTQRPYAANAPTDVIPKGFTHEVVLDEGSQHSGLEGMMIGGLTNKLLDSMRLGNAKSNFDKPPDPRLAPIVNRICDPLATSDGIDHSYRMGLSENAFSASEKDITYVDQNPNLNSLKSIESMVRLDPIKVATSYLYKFLVTPNAFDRIDRATETAPSPIIDGPVMVPVAISRTMVGYISAPFRYWRGGLKYRFQFVATEYHTGRFLVAYLPAFDITTSARVKENQLWNYPNMVMDLQSAHDFTFEVPYTSVFPWTKTVPPQIEGEGVTINSFVADYPFHTGTIVITALNQLNAPETVAQEIDINLWFSAGSDFELRFPMSPLPPGFVKEVKVGDQIATMDLEGEHASDSYYRYPLITVNPGVAALNIPWVKVTGAGTLVKPFHGQQQAGCEDPCATSVDDLPRSETVDEPSEQLLKTKGPAALGRDTVNPVLESHMNLRHLWRRFVWGGSLRLYEKDSWESHWAVPVHPSADMQSIESFQIKVVDKHAGVDDLFPAAYAGTPLSYWTSIYRFWRGSIRYKFFCSGENVRLSAYLVPFRYLSTEPATATVATALTLPFQNKTVNYQLFPDTKFGAMAVNSGRFCLEVEVPYYSHWPIHPVQNGTTIDARLNKPEYFGLPNLMLVVSARSTTYSPMEPLEEFITYSIAAGDDYAVALPVGVPVTIATLYGIGKSA